MAALQFERRGNLAVVTLNRPTARNAINPEVAVALDRAWCEIAEDPEIRVAIVTGAGSDAFCSGIDLIRLVPLLNGTRKPEDEWDEAVLSDRAITSRALLRDFDPQKPIIAAMNGSAIAGGMEIAQACDLRVSVNHAEFGLQEPKWGLFPIGGSTVRLPRQLPHAHAMELLLTGSLISAKQADRMGFLNRVVSSHELMPTAQELAETIAANGPVAVSAIRRSVRECTGLPLQDALRKELEIGTPVFATADAREGPRAFLEKRKPRFEGC